MADLALRPLSMGELLDRAFTIFRQRFGAIILSLVVSLAFPILLLTNNIKSLMDLSLQQQTAMTPEATMQVAFALFGKMATIGIVFLVAMVVGKAAVLWITHKAMLGDVADVWSSLGHGFKAFFPLLGLAFLEIAIYIAAEVVLYIPLLALGLGGAATRGAVPGAGIGIALIAWFVIFFFAMLYLSAALFVTTSVLMAEIDGGVFKSVARSFELTQGRRGHILGMLLLVTVLLWIVMLGASFGVGFVLALSGSGSGPGGNGAIMTATFGLMALFGLLVVGFFNVLQMTTYYDLRVRKEGLDLELASAAMPAT